jgi:hypothetical protein
VASRPVFSGPAALPASADAVRSAPTVLVDPADRMDPAPAVAPAA